MKYHKINNKIERLTAKLAALSAKYNELENDYKKTKQALDSTLHEVRRFSSEISANADSLSKQLRQYGADERIQELCETVFYTSGMISSRLAFTDLELNPASVRLQLEVRTGLYKKFEKARHVLAYRARVQHTPIRLIGNSYMEIDALQSFELVPFVILDNALKYSPNDQEITVKFEENLERSDLTIQVSSMGPIIKPEERQVIFERGVRGSYAAELPVAGDGLGLYLAKFLCDYHGIDLSASSERQRQISINNTPYAPFNVCLHVTR